MPFPARQRWRGSSTGSGHPLNPHCCPEGGVGFASTRATPVLGWKRRENRDLFLSTAFYEACMGILNINNKKLINRLQTTLGGVSEKLKESAGINRVFTTSLCRELIWNEWHANWINENTCESIKKVQLEKSKLNEKREKMRINSPSPLKEREFVLEMNLSFFVTVYLWDSKGGRA